MIRVNMLRDAIGSSSGAGGGGGGAAPSGVGIDEASEAPREKAGGNFDIIVKMFFLLVPFVLCYLYRDYQIGLKKAQQDALQADLTELQAKLKSYDPGLKDIEKFQEEKQKLDNQLGVIKNLSKERLKNVKSMDALQGIIPKKAWLTSLKINDNVVQMQGVATDDLVISDFMKDLEASIYFTNVLLEGSEETRTTEGAQKIFRIKCGLQNL